MIHQFIFAGPKPSLAAEGVQGYWICFHAVGATRLASARPVGYGFDEPRIDVIEVCSFDNLDTRARLPGKWTDALRRRVLTYFHRRPICLDLRRLGVLDHPARRT